MRILAPLATLLVALACPAAAQEVRSPCGETVRVERGDTLSRIAERCDVSERGLVRANPRVDSSGDLRAGMELRLRPQEAAGGTADQLRSLADEAGSALSGVARDIGSSVDDILDKNPDLRERLRGLGDRLNVPLATPRGDAGRGQSNRGDASRATVSISPDAGATGTSVTVTATGLPPDAPAVIGGGPPRTAYEVLDRARTSREGTLTATVRVPDWAADSERFTFVVSGENAEWTVRSRTFQVTGSRL